VLTLAWTLPAQASTISIEFGASGSQLGRGRVDSSGNWVHNASRINGTTTPGDPAVGNQAGFSDFNLWDAVGFGEYPLDYGVTYDFRDGFYLPYFNGDFLVWDEGADPYNPYGGAMFGGTLNLSTITMAADGMGFSLSGTLTDMWFDDSIASTVLFDIANADSADFTMYVAANKDLVDRLNRGKGNTKTKVVSGSISIDQAQATPEPSGVLLMASALGCGLFLFHRQRGPATAKRG
jgi:hypothetical protein